MDIECKVKYKVAVILDVILFMNPIFNTFRISMLTDNRLWELCTNYHYQLCLKIVDTVLEMYPLLFYKFDNFPFLFQGLHPVYIEPFTSTIFMAFKV